jgi:hypothetical protein
MLLTVYLYTSNIFVQVRELYVFIHNFSHLQPLRCSLKTYMPVVPILDIRIASYPGRFVKNLVSLLPLIFTGLYHYHYSLGPDGLTFFQSRVLSASNPYSYASCPPSTLTVTQPTDLIFFSLMSIQPCVLTASYPHSLVSSQPRILTASYPHCLVS